MSKLFFRYGSMSSSKTANALMVKHNYEEKGMKALLIKPATDNRDGEHIVASRVGISSVATLIYEGEDLFSRIKDRLVWEDTKCIIVDEAQFFSKQQIGDLCRIVDEMNIPVICYGLRTDFRGELFEGSQWLLAWADTIEEIKTICHCEKKATMNMRRSKDGVPLFDGDQVMIGGDDVYQSVCRKHFYSERGKLSDGLGRYKTT